MASVYLPLIEAHRSENEPDRIERLRRVYSLVQNLFLLVEMRPLPKNVVVALNDHKGQLAVIYVDQEWLEFVSPFFELAWRSEGEASDAVLSSIQQ